MVFRNQQQGSLATATIKVFGRERRVMAYTDTIYFILLIFSVFGIGALLGSGVCGLLSQ